MRELKRKTKKKNGAGFHSNYSVRVIVKSIAKCVNLKAKSLAFRTHFELRRTSS